MKKNMKKTVQGKNVRSYYTLLGLLISVGILSGCQGPTAGNEVDLTCASVASDRAGMVSCATSIVEQLSVEQKVAQMIQGEIRGLTADDVKKYGLGSVLNGGGGFPGGSGGCTRCMVVGLRQLAAVLMMRC